ncbi:MAG: hypothetical protein ACJ8AD_14775 [Gemmatimonadaceae bacterium]
MARLSEAEKAARVNAAGHIRDIIDEKHGAVRTVYRSRINAEAQRQNVAKLQMEIDALNHVLRLLGENGEE